MHPCVIETKSNKRKLSVPPQQLMELRAKIFNQLTAVYFKRTLPSLGRPNVGPLGPLPFCFRHPRQLLHRLSGSLIHEHKESSSNRSLSSKENLSFSPSQSNIKSIVPSQLPHTKTNRPIHSTSLTRHLTISTGQVSNSDFPPRIALVWDFRAFSARLRC